MIKVRWQWKTLTLIQLRNLSEKKCTELHRKCIILSVSDIDKMEMKYTSIRAEDYEKKKCPLLPSEVKQPSRVSGLRSGDTSEQVINFERMSSFVDVMFI